MIGNDIVDIIAAERQSNWQRKGFLKKVFTDKEQIYIANSDRPVLTVWLLWSMKESAYKIYVQQYLNCFLSPLKFECAPIIKLDGVYNSEVFIKNSSYKTFSYVSSGKISTIALLKNKLPEAVIIKKIFTFSKTDYYTQHRETYENTLKDFSEKINKPLKHLSIKKDSYGIPHLYYKLSLIPVSVSLSHHGRFGAYAISINPQLSNP
jgi:phosphopantetheinyl transferase (holo-ACP synthase)